MFSFNDTNSSKENINELLNILSSENPHSKISEKLFEPIKQDTHSKDIINNLFNSFQNNTLDTSQETKKELLKTFENNISLDLFNSLFSKGQKLPLKENLQLDFQSLLKNIDYSKVFSMLKHFFFIVPEHFKIPLILIILYIIHKPIFFIIKIILFFIKIIYYSVIFIVLAVLSIFSIKRTYELVKENLIDKNIEDNKKYF